MWSLRASATILCLAGCANSDPLTGGAGGASTGGTGSGASSSDGGSTNVSTSSSTTSTGPSCDEQPCKLVAPQCGCDEDAACSVDGNGGRICVVAGTVQPGQICDANNYCAPGSVCVGYTDGETTCAEFCNSDVECTAPGGKCVLPLTGAPTVMLCSENCELVTSQGCPLANSSCQIGVTASDEPYTLCVPSGAGVEQSVCADSSECAPGFTCLPTTANDSRCFEWCNVNGGSCPINESCLGLEISTGVPLVIGNVTYGVCNPN
ncbi:MAG: hypothetical protein U0271_23615 [Polyangiaceae bacterium]